MELFKNWTERYMQIIGKYDGGKSYKWSDAASDLSALECDMRSARVRRVFRSEWKRQLAWLLMRAVIEEKKRVLSIQ
jgi:hypothetical protein